MKAEAEKRGINLQFSDAQGKEENQLKAIRSFIAQKVDAIIVAPVVVTGWAPVLKEAQAAQNPVFIVDRAVEADPSLFVTRIAADFSLEGKLAGEWVAKTSNGKCNVVELQGAQGAAPAILRKKGFESAVAAFPDIKIVKSKTGNWTDTGGKEVMQDFIKSTDGLKGICAVWAHNDNMMLGAIQAMKEAGLKPGSPELLTVSVDGVPGIFKAMVDGESDMSVELRSDIGKDIYDVVQGYLKGKTDYPKWVVIPSAVHTPADAAEMLKRRGV
jgi:simple sugar transport system substrate-binding protein